MSRIVFLNRFFHPDHSATSQIVGDLAFGLAQAGRDVAVITSGQIYDEPAARLPVREVVRGVDIRRIATTRFGRAGLAGRTLDYLSFYSAAAWQLQRSLRPGDIVVAKTDPPLLSIVASAVARRRKAKLINWLQDLYPEVATELKVPLPAGFAGRLTRWRDRSLRLAHANVVLGTSMASRVEAAGVARERIHVIPNWTDDERIVPQTSDNPLRRDWDLGGKFVIGYSGNLGRAHEFETILGAAERLRDRADLVFIMIGGGKQSEALAQRVRERGLGGSFRFLPYQSRDKLPETLAVPDVHWISMRPELEGLIFPSKFYGIAAAGRPLIALTGGGGEIAALVRRYECGCVVEPGDDALLAQAIAQLAADRPACEAMGRRARAMLEAEFTRANAFARWDALLRQIDGMA